MVVVAAVAVAVAAVVVVVVVVLVVVVVAAAAAAVVADPKNGHNGRRARIRSIVLKCSIGQNQQESHLLWSIILYIRTTMAWPDS